MKGQEPSSSSTPRPNNLGPHSMHSAPTLTTLTQSDHEIIRTFLSNVPVGFPLSPGAALAELTGFAPLSPGLVGLAVAPSAHGYHMSPSRFDPGSPSRFPPFPADPLATASYKTRGVNSPMRSNVESPLRHSTDGYTLKKFDHLASYSPHRRSPSPTRGYTSPFPKFHSNHVYAPILPSRAFEYTTPAPSPAPPTLKEEPNPEFRIDPPTRVEEESTDKEQPDRNTKSTNKVMKKKRPLKPNLKKAKKPGVARAEAKVGVSTELKAVEKTTKEVENRLKEGCSCGQNCFQGLNPATVFRHRTNISKLTKGEHDMYMMGMMMGTLADPDHIVKGHKQRKRKKNNYIYQGREVCRDAYVYLENVSIYQLRLIRKHVTENGVVPTRTHKNTDKKPVHTLTQEHTKEAHIFLQEFLASENSGRKKGLGDLTFKYLHHKYRCHYSDSGQATMAYSTFRKFVNHRFPLIKFKNGILEGNVGKLGREGKKGIENPKAGNEGREAVQSINLPPNSAIKSETQILRTFPKAKLGET